MPQPAHHLAEYAAAGRTGLVFVGARRGVLRRRNPRCVHPAIVGRSQTSTASPHRVSSGCRNGNHITRLADLACRRLPHREA